LVHFEEKEKIREGNTKWDVIETTHGSPGDLLAAFKRTENAV